MKQSIHDAPLTSCPRCEAPVKRILSAALASFLEYIWGTFDVERLQAGVFAWNPASARVLEKNGFEQEGTRHRAIFKDGQLIDLLIYTLFRQEPT